MTTKTTPKVKAKKRRWRLSRRGFLIGTGATLGVLAIGGKLALDRGRMFIAEFEGGDFGTPPGDPDLWLELAPDNTLTLYSPKGEFGQGIHTTFAQIAAEELEADWEKMRVVQADTQHGFESFAMTTVGSLSTSSMYKPIREAAATLREMLRLQASKIWGVDPSLVFALKGVMTRQDIPTQTLSYGELAASTTTWEVPAEKAVLKPVREFHIIGHVVQRLDLPDKVMGKATYGYDARLEGMLYGAVARPPRYGATLKAVNSSKAETMPGVVQVVTDDNFAGVVAETRAQAWQAVQALETEWEGGITWNDEDLRKAVTVPERGGVVVRRDGNARSKLRGDVIEVDYRTPLAAHAHLEPQAALVHVQGDKAEAWISTQTPPSEAIAKATGLGPDKIVIYPRYMGGAFGRKFGNDVGVEAAKLSQAVAKPVHVGWNRLEEMPTVFFARRPIRRFAPP
jgi:isoquinoline 1-oxidoreductase subunit beta